MLAQPLRHAPLTSIVLLMLTGASMASQATRLLVQADWISTAGAIWDTSHVLSERSLVGQLAYALVGYEASPAAVEIIAYTGSLLFVALAYLAGKIKNVIDRD